ncbi:S1 family peptidase [Streptomyces phyllanthi]
MAGTGSGLVSRLGDARTAGSWIGADGEPVVAVTDEEAAAEVKAAGARPKKVRYSMDDLNSATEKLRSAPRVAGTSWVIDRSSNEVVVRADKTVSSKDWKRLTKLAEEIGGPVRMERMEGTYTTRLNGGRPIFASGGRCSVGFNVTNGQGQFILTAGHCGPAGSVWFSDTAGTQQVGRTITSNFPGADFSLVQYAEGQGDDATNVVDIGDGRGVRITSVADATVGQKVFRSGSTTGLADGEVTALDATVNYPEGTVTGLIETTLCAEPGDSGGPLFSEGVALGVTSGGNGDCESGGTTFFQPINKALTALNVQLTGVEGGSSAGEPAPAASASEGAVAPGAAQPGAVLPVETSDKVNALLEQLSNPRNAGPGLLVIAGSLVALVATRYIRTEQERNAYRRQYARSWG